MWAPAKRLSLAQFAAEAESEIYPDAVERRGVISAGNAG